MKAGQTQIDTGAEKLHQSLVFPVLRRHGDAELLHLLRTCRTDVLSGDDQLAGIRRIGTENCPEKFCSPRAKQTSDAKDLALVDREVDIIE